MITPKDIKFRRLPEDPEDPIPKVQFEATCILTSRYETAVEFLDPLKSTKHIEESLRKRIMHYIYGDLREPLNQLLLIAYAKENKPEVTKIYEQLKELL